MVFLGGDAFLLLRLVAVVFFFVVFFAPSAAFTAFFFADFFFAVAFLVGIVWIGKRIFDFQGKLQETCHHDRGILPASAGILLCLG